MKKGTQYTFHNMTLKETQRADGRFMATGRDPITQRPRAFYSRVRGEAALAAAKSLARLEGNNLGAFYLQVFLPTVAMREPAWRYQIKWAWDNYLMPALAERPIAEIKRKDLQILFNNIARKLKISSVRRIKIVLSCILNLAVADEYISSNPCASIRLAAEEVPNKQSLSFGQLQTLINASSGSLQNAIVLMSYGLRIAEACGSTVGHLVDGCVRVDQQFTQDAGGAKIKRKLKTRHSNRTIPLTSDAIDLLRSNAGDSLFLIHTRTGKPMTPNNLHRELKELLSTLPDFPMITPHELRHTFITLLENEIEAPHPVVCALAGKAYRSATSAYNHASPKLLRKWSEKYWDCFWNNSESSGRITQEA